MYTATKLVRKAVSAFVSSAAGTGSIPNVTGHAVVCLMRERYRGLAHGIVGTYMSRRWPLLSALFFHSHTSSPYDAQPSLNLKCTTTGMRRQAYARTYASNVSLRVGRGAGDALHKYRFSLRFSRGLLMKFEHFFRFSLLLIANKWRYQHALRLVEKMSFTDSSWSDLSSQKRMIAQPTFILSSARNSLRHLSRNLVAIPFLMLTPCCALPAWPVVRAVVHPRNQREQPTLHKKYKTQNE